MGQVDYSNGSIKLDHYKLAIELFSRIDWPEDAVDDKDYAVWIEDRSNLWDEDYEFHLCWEAKGDNSVDADADADADDGAGS